MTERFETSCCGKPMRSLGEVDFVNPQVTRVQRWFCPKCGRSVDLVDYCLGEDELRNTLELYGRADKTASPRSPSKASIRLRSRRGCATVSTASRGLPAAMAQLQASGVQVVAFDGGWLVPAAGGESAEFELARSLVASLRDYCLDEDEFRELLKLSGQADEGAALHNLSKRGSRVPGSAGRAVSGGLSPRGSGERRWRRRWQNNKWQSHPR